MFNNRTATVAYSVCISNNNMPDYMNSSQVYIYQQLNTILVWTYANN